MKGFLFFLLMLIVFLGGGLYLVSGMILDKGSEIAISELLKANREDDILLNSVNYDTARLSSWNAVTWSNVFIEASIKEEAPSKKRIPSEIRLDELILTLDDFQARRFRVTVNGLDYMRQRGKQTDRLLGETLDTAVTIDFTSRVEAQIAIRDFIRELSVLFREGRTKLPIEFSGISTFVIKVKPVNARLSMGWRDGESNLTMDPVDLKQISNQLEEPLTEAEIKVVSEYALRAPRLLRIRDQAQITSRDARQKDSSVPEDAYRHVLWSFLLTRAYGADFAKVVTDAHEEGETGNTALERKMDYHNNEIGRSYAKKGYSESSLLGRAMTDAEVIRTAVRPPPPPAPKPVIQTAPAVPV